MRCPCTLPTMAGSRSASSRLVWRWTTTSSAAPPTWAERPDGAIYNARMRPKIIPTVPVNTHTPSADHAEAPLPQRLPA
jgi:hypothetical protein